MKKPGAIFWMAISICCGVFTASGGDIKVPGEKTDCGIISPETLQFVGQFNARIGTQKVAPEKADGIVFVLVFKLPDLPANASIVSAGLQINLETSGTASADKTFKHKADLYGVRTDSDNKVMGSDYFLGETGSDTQATLIQGGILTKETPDGLVHTDADGGKKLAEWLASIYKEGGAGQFVFLRLNPDVQSGPYRFYVISTADNPKEELRPVLTITTK